MEFWTKLFADFWAEIMATGAVGLIAIKTFIFDKIGSKKINTKFIDLSSIQRGVEVKVEKANEVVYNEIDKLKVVIQQFVKSLEMQKVENTALTSLVVQLLSMMNLPLEQRQSTFNALKSISSINEQVMKAFEQSLNSQQVIKTQEIKSDDTIQQDLKRL